MALLLKLYFSMLDDENEVDEAEAGPSTAPDGFRSHPPADEVEDGGEVADSPATLAGDPGDAAQEPVEDVPEDGAHSG